MGLRLALGADYLTRRGVSDPAAVTALESECRRVRDAMEASS
jgi:hypothetical protein